MASYFTVNVAIHFLFNWKPGKTRSPSQNLPEANVTDDRRLSGLLQRMSFLSKNSFLVSTLQKSGLFGDGTPSPKPKTNLKRIKSSKVVVMTGAAAAEENKV